MVTVKDFEANTGPRKLEVRYSDEDCTENIVAERIASASWKGASEPKLELDRKEYRRYDTYMTVKLTDYDENVSSGARDVVHVYAKAGSRKYGYSVLSYI